MLKRRIKYTDFDDNEREEDFYFHLTKAEILELQMGEMGGLKKTLEKIIQEQDMPKIVEYFKGIVMKAYGKKSMDGRRFDKSEAITADFTSTEAYSILFMERATDAVASAAFINGIVPSNLSEQPNKGPVES